MNSLYYSDFSTREQVFFYFLNGKANILSKYSYTEGRDVIEGDWRENIGSNLRFWTEWLEYSSVIDPEKYLTHTDKEVRNFVKTYLERIVK